MVYDVRILQSAGRELERIPARELSRVLIRIGSLATQPRPAGVQKLRGAADRYRIRQGRFRILYRVDDVMRCVYVYAVGDRKDVYR